VERQAEKADQAVRDIRRATRRRYAAEEKVRIVIASLRGEDSIATSGSRPDSFERRCCSTRAAPVLPRLRTLYRGCFVLDRRPTFAARVAARHGPLREGLHRFSRPTNFRAKSNFQ
jgi:hypothetical protein